MVQQLIELTKFGFVGCLAYSVHIISSIFVHESVGLDGATSAAAGVVFSALASYFGHKYITFQSSSSHHVSGPRFVSSILNGVVTSYIGGFLLIDYLGIAAHVAVPMVAALVILINYFLMKFWIFRS